MRRQPLYKQMAFETAVRNPERYINILKTIYEFNGLILNDENLLKIVSKLYIEKIVSSNSILIDENTTIKDIEHDVKEVNNSRRSDGGFPTGYAARILDIYANSIGAWSCICSI